MMNAMEAMAEVTDRPCSITIPPANCGREGDLWRSPIPAAALNRSSPSDFDSFYSTKAQGMGMGLTISASIIERHRGN